MKERGEAKNAGDWQVLGRGCDCVSRRKDHLGVQGVAGLLKM